MKKRFIMLLAACCLLAALSVSACALEYTFDSPSTGDFGTPTSSSQAPYPSLHPMDEAHSFRCSSSSDCNRFAGLQSERERENPNTDKSKNSALIPPGFGTPTSYLPNSGEFLTPNLAADGPLNSPSLMASAGGANTSGGAVILPGPVGAVSGTPPTFAVSNSAADTGAGSTSGGYTEVTEDSYYSNGSLGTLKIPAIDLTVKIYQGTGSDTLKKGAGHFTNTSIWNGNACFAAHNRGANSYFGEVHTLENGDRITLTTKEGTRTYAVTSVAKISETDNSMLESTSENCITLFTCVRDQREYRWCVRAVEI